MRAVKEWAPQHYNSTGSARLLSLMSRGLLLALIGALLIVRLPSLAQPMGSDQGDAYVGGADSAMVSSPIATRGTRSRRAIHYVYAALRTLSPRDAIVPAADLAAAAARGGAALDPSAPAWGGHSPAGLSARPCSCCSSDPSLARYGGMRVRAQAETFIALGLTGAIALRTRSPEVLRVLSVPRVLRALVLAVPMVLAVRRVR